MNFKFFTTPYQDWDYHLIPFSRWKKGYQRKFKEAIIDPGVSTLSGKSEYPHIGKYPLKTPPNVFWTSPDYPTNIAAAKSGPLLTPDECLDMTWRNAYKWKNEPNVIIPVQFYFNDIESFKENYLMAYEIAERIGIANIAKSKDMRFLRNMVDFINKNNPENKWVHYFGPRKNIIKYIVSRKHITFPISVDSMKWDWENFMKTNIRKDRWEAFLGYYESVIKVMNRYKSVSKLDRLITEVK